MHRPGFLFAIMKECRVWLHFCIRVVPALTAAGNGEMLFNHHQGLSGQAKDR